jgi:3-hydroxyacyl-CoA dehydrogenase
MAAVSLKFKVIATTGYTVNVIDVSDAALDKSKAIISKSVDRVAKKKFKVRVVCETASIFGFGIRI